jgi:hypothetical protein
MALIRHELAQLPTTIQQALAYASIEGEEFRASVLADALARSTPEVERELAGIARDGWHGCARRRRFLAKIARHHERGRRFSRAVAALISAADHAASIAAPREASSYYARARALQQRATARHRTTALHRKSAQQQKRELRA